MKDKNKKLIMLITVLLVSIGISFAYYTSKLLGGGVGGNINVSTAVINGSTLKVEGTLSFDDENILPGHKNISSIKVTATGKGDIIPYNLIWNGINNLGTSLNFTVYKTNNKVTTSINCIEEKGIQEGKQTLNEKCTIENIESLGEILATGTISQNETATKTILAKDEVITSSEAGTSVYYYVILEYPNLEENQNEDKGKGFEGKVTVEKSEISADINILAVNISDDKENYTKVDDIPQTGYTLNTSKSTCTNGTNPRWENSELILANLTKSGTSCMLYFDKEEKKPNASETIIAGNNPKPGTNSFTKAATTEADSGFFSTTDDDGTTNYYRGIVNNNWVDFAGFKWRIIRTNGDGSIRMIYNGTSYTTTGTTTQLQTSAFNSTANDNAYVGYMYGKTGQNTYAATHANTNSSTIKGILDNWYKTNIVDKNYDKYVSKEAGFCGDRQIATTSRNNYTNQGYGTYKTAYATVDRVMDASWSAKGTQTPTYSCNTNDLYTVAASPKGNHALQYPVGLITSDEVVYAGGFYGAQNQQYYLYTNKYYWTMSPVYYDNGYAHVFYVYDNGNFYYNWVSEAGYGVRPVINLSASVQLTGSGTTTDSFKIVGA